MTRLLVFAPLRAEAAALGSRPGWRVLRSGMGPAKARIAAARGLAIDADAVAIAGVCAAVAPELRAGDVVCASELVSEHGETISVPGAESLAAALRRRGFRVHVGPVASVERLTGPGERSALDGVLAVDLESAWLAAAAGGRPLAVLRVVVETAGRRLIDPRTLVAGTQALVNLRRAGGALDEWAGAAMVPAMRTPTPVLR